MSILLEQHGTEVEDAFNKVGEVFNQFEAEYNVLQQNLRDDRLGRLTELKDNEPRSHKPPKTYGRPCCVPRSAGTANPRYCTSPMVASLVTDLNNRQRAYLHAMLYRECSCPNLTGCGREEEPDWKENKLGQSSRPSSNGRSPPSRRRPFSIRSCLSRAGTRRRAAGHAELMVCPRTACNIPPTRTAAQARPPEAPA